MNSTSFCLINTSFAFILRGYIFGASIFQIFQAHDQNFSVRKSHRRVSERQPGELCHRHFRWKFFFQAYGIGVHFLNSRLTGKAPECPWIPRKKRKQLYLGNIRVVSWYCHHDSVGTNIHHQNLELLFVQTLPSILVQQSPNVSNHHVVVRLGHNVEALVWPSWKRTLSYLLHIVNEHAQLSAFFFIRRSGSFCEQGRVRMTGLAPVSFVLGAVQVPLWLQVHLFLIHEGLRPIRCWTWALVCDHEFHSQNALLLWMQQRKLCILGFAIDWNATSMPYPSRIFTSWTSVPSGIADNALVFG